MYTNVDWPIRFHFVNGAHVNYIKNRLDGQGGDPNLSPELGEFGSGVHLKLWDSLFVDYHDVDNGIKRGLSCPPNDPANWDYHMRIYAANPDGSSVDFGYSSAWGHWVVASVHRDREYLPWKGGPLCSNRYYSREADETWFNQRILIMNLFLYYSEQWTIYTNSYYWANPESGPNPGCGAWRPHDRRTPRIALRATAGIQQPTYRRPFRLHLLRGRGSCSRWRRSARRILLAGRILLAPGG